MQRNINGFLPDGSVTDVKLSTALRQSLRQKNYFKNPNFAVIQGTAFGTVAGTLPNSLAVPTASTGYSGETEWGIAAAGGTPTYAFSQLNENVTFTGAAGVTAIHLLQRLEAVDTNKLKSKTVAFSVDISNSLLTSVTWELFNPTTTDDTHGTIATPTQTLISSGTFTVNSTLTRYSATIALPTGVSRGLEVRLRVGAQTSGTWVVSRLQLEENAISTNFSCDDFTIELKKCQRYFQSTGSSFIGRTVGTTLIELSVPYVERMRASPVIGSISGAVFAARYQGGDLSITNPVTQNTSGSTIGLWTQIVTAALVAGEAVTSRNNTATSVTDFFALSAHIS